MPLFTESPVKLDDRLDEEALLSNGLESKHEDTGMTHNTCRRPLHRRNWGARFIVSGIIINICLFLVLSYLIVSPTTAHTGNWRYKTNKNQALKQMTYYSPYLDQVEIPFKQTQVDGFLVDPTYPQSIYKQEPSPEVDAAWSRLYNFRYKVISEDEVRQLDKDPRLTVKAPISWGYGDNAYISRTDVAHRIHCLDMLRKATYPESVYPHLRDGEEETRVLWRPHVMHCTHVLLQHLMCTATLEAVTYNWMEGMRFPIADFSINRQCLDVEAIIRWEEERDVVLDFDDIKKIDEWLDNVPADTPRIPVPKPYLDLFNSTGSGMGLL
ncbi:hypothetical protein GE09DRAFT_1257804 [Coniochaeta sp. 2T2.1]|nr:hypothetical protein GE09DRAFT_1257804 [Coniochaeta sp. 2T2.1]